MQCTVCPCTKPIGAVHCPYTEPFDVMHTLSAYRTFRCHAHTASVRNLLMPCTHCSCTEPFDALRTLLMYRTSLYHAHTAYLQNISMTCTHCPCTDHVINYCAIGKVATNVFKKCGAVAVLKADLNFTINTEVFGNDLFCSPTGYIAECEDIQPQ